MKFAIVLIMVLLIGVLLNKLIDMMFNDLDR